MPNPCHPRGVDARPPTHALSWLLARPMSRSRGAPEEHRRRAPASPGAQGRPPSNPTLGMGAGGAARWSRMWGKSIQGRGSAYAKSRKRESGAFGHRKSFQPGGNAEGSRAPGGERRPVIVAELGTNAQRQLWWTGPPPVHRTAGRPHLGGKNPAERGRLPLGGDGEKELQCWRVYTAFEVGASLHVASLLRGPCKTTPLEYC